jgi:hypothetical protein
MLVVNRVRQRLAHQDMSVPTLYANMAGQCAAFCKLHSGATDSGLFSLLLLDGDAVAAKEVLSKSAISLTGVTRKLHTGL